MVIYEMYFYRRDKQSASSSGYLAYKSNEPENYPIFNLKYSIEVNKAGSCSFTVGVTHPHYDKVEEMNTFVSIVVKYIKNGVEKHKYCPFVGRVLEISEDNYGNKEVTCEGALSTLNDSFERVNSVIGAIYDSAIYAREAIDNIMYEHSEFHRIGYADYAGIWNSSYSTQEGDRIFNIIDNSSNNPEGIKHPPDYGPLISYTSTESDELRDDNSIKSLYDMLFSTVLKKAGGFILTVNEQISLNRVTCYWTYYQSGRYNDYYSNYRGIINYPNESESSIPFDRTAYIPHFTKGYNIVNVSKESSLKTKFNMIIPVGKDNLRISEGHPSYQVIDVGNDSPYEDFIPIVINFPDIDNAETLRSYAQTWADKHSRDSSIPKKFTITGPEPCGVGCGEYLIMLMRDVIIREDPSEELINSLMLPCLSMEIDVQNPQNNVYVIGPFIDDTYIETTISTK